MSDLLSLYIKDVDKEYHRLFPEYKTWDKKIFSNRYFLEIFEEYKKGCKMAREKLIVSQLKLVYDNILRLSHRYNTSLDIEDLIGFANEHSINILDSYDPYCGFTKAEIAEGKFNKFPSYIRNFVECYVKNEIKKYGNTVRIPVNVINQLTHNQRIESNLAHKNKIPENGKSYEINGKKLLYNQNEQYGLDDIDVCYNMESDYTYETNIFSELKQLLSSQEYAVLKELTVNGNKSSYLAKTLPPFSNKSYRKLITSSKNVLTIYLPNNTEKNITIYSNIFINETFTFITPSNNEVIYTNINKISFTNEELNNSKIKLNGRYVKKTTCDLKQGQAWSTKEINEIHEKALEKSKKYLTQKELV